MVLWCYLTVWCSHSFWCLWVFHGGTRQLFLFPNLPGLIVFTWIVGHRWVWPIRDRGTCVPYIHCTPGYASRLCWVFYKQKGSLDYISLLGRYLSQIPSRCILSEYKQLLTFSTSGSSIIIVYSNQMESNFSSFQSEEWIYTISNFDKLSLITRERDGG